MATNSAPENGATSKIDVAAEKAYAEAAAVETAKPAKKPAAKKVAAKKASVGKVPAKKAPVKKTAPKKATVKKAASKAAPKKASKTPTKPTQAASPVSKIKDTIMAKAKETKVTDTITDGAKEIAADVQNRVKTAAAQAGEFAGEVTEFNKENLEAVVETGKILLAGAQEMGRSNIETGKTVVATVSADVKKMASVKSPTELVQLQGELARRNLDAAISFGSKNTEIWLKIYNDAFAPISSRVSVAAERIKKAA